MSMRDKTHAQAWDNWRYLINQFIKKSCTAEKCVLADVPQRKKEKSLLAAVKAFIPTKVGSWRKDIILLHGNL